MVTGASSRCGPWWATSAPHSDSPGARIQARPREVSEVSPTLKQSRNLGLQIKRLRGRPTLYEVYLPKRQPPPRRG